MCYSLPRGIGFSEYGSDWKLILLCAGICDGGIEGKDNFVSYPSAGLSAWSKQHSGASGWRDSSQGSMMSS